MLEMLQQQHMMLLKNRSSSCCSSEAKTINHSSSSIIKECQQSKRHTKKESIHRAMARAVCKRLLFDCICCYLLLSREYREMQFLHSLELCDDAPTLCTLLRRRLLLHNTSPPTNHNNARRGTRT